ncbi:hypothetical protein K474DRAFT_1592718, partial [Panus rudis PR-1116 ss-1]
MDPFRPLFTNCSHQLRRSDNNLAKSLLERLSTYLSAQFSRQHRMFTFALCVFGRYTRFLRVDRSGIVVSEAFNYIANPRILAEFLWRYNHLSASKRGFDPYSQPASLSERRMLNRAITEYTKLAKAEEARRFPQMRKSLSSDYPAYRIRAVDEYSGALQYYIVRRPFTGGQSLFGRATRGYVALRIYDDQDEEATEGKALLKRLAFLKDSWRIVEGEMEREVDIYEELKAHHIPFIPSVLCAGDHSRWETLSRKARRAYIHHRVVQELAFPLSTVTNAKELVHVIRDALQSLIEAYTKLRRVHRDVSDRNIMINDVREGDSTAHGVLNDWDMSCILNEDESTTATRVGTWYFMSAHLLYDPRRTNGFYDDLESILWVFLYVAVHHFKYTG